jgi:hypothetical protein
MQTLLVIDGTNILNRVFFQCWKQSLDGAMPSGIAFHSAFVTLNKYYQKYKPSKMIICFDRPNWRKEYTQSKEAISPLIYKGNRNQDMTPSELIRYEEFKRHVSDFEAILREYTSINVLSAELLEADDLIGGVVQHCPDDRIILLSADKDFIQLLRTPNVMLIDPATDTPRTCDDVDWFIFEKCIRGDRGDNVGSAYPRVKTTRLQKAYADEFERLSLFSDNWVSPLGKTMNVGELFQENKKLMDLSCQPPEIRQLIEDTVTTGLQSSAKFSIFHFKKFCNRHQLIKIVEQCGNYVKMLSNT